VWRRGPYTPVKFLPQERRYLVCKFPHLHVKVPPLLLNELQLTISESKILLVLYHRLGFTKEGAVLGIQDLVLDSHLKP
jgi:hypothetical protein